MPMLLSGPDLLVACSFLYHLARALWLRPHPEPRRRGRFHHRPGLGTFPAPSTGRRRDDSDAQFSNRLDRRVRVRPRVRGLFSRCCAAAQRRISTAVWRRRSGRYVPTSSISMLHFEGTCWILPLENMSFVDSALRMRGAQGLRVVDASVISLISAGVARACGWWCTLKAGEAEGGL